MYVMGKMFCLDKRLHSLSVELVSAKCQRVESCDSFETHYIFSWTIICVLELCQSVMLNCSASKSDCPVYRKNLNYFPMTHSTRRVSVTQAFYTHANVFINLSHSTTKPRDNGTNKWTRSFCGVIETSRTLLSPIINLI